MLCEGIDSLAVALQVEGLVMDGRFPKSPHTNHSPTPFLGTPTPVLCAAPGSHSLSSLPRLPVQGSKDSKHLLTLSRDQVEESRRHIWVLGQTFTYQDNRVNTPRGTFINDQVVILRNNMDDQSQGHQNSEKETCKQWGYGSLGFL